MVALRPIDVEVLLKSNKSSITKCFCTLQLNLIAELERQAPMKPKGQSRSLQ